MHDFDLPVYLQDFLKEKKQQGYSTKTKHLQIKLFMPFHLLSIRSKKIDCSEFHKQIHDFELPIHWDFFWRAKSRETVPKRNTNESNTSRPYSLLSLHYK